MARRKNSSKHLLPFLCLALLAAGGRLQGAAPQTLTFLSPSFDEPHYRIGLVVSVAKDKTVLKDIRLNGEPQMRAFIFRDGRHIGRGTALEKGTYEIVVDYAWSSGKNYRLTLVTEAEGQKPKSLEASGRSPESGGIPGGKEGFYRVYTVQEEAGRDRQAELVRLVLTGPKSEVKGGAFAIFDGRNRVPCEILEKEESLPPEKASADHPATLTYQIGLQLDARAGEKKLLLVLLDESPLTAEPGVKLAGESLGKTVDNGALVLGLSPQSGQVNTIALPGAAIELHNKAGVIHWNPDVFIPGLAWDHSFDWNPPPFFEEKAASLVYVNSRRGPMPRIQDVHLEVKYTVEAGKPYFLSETRLGFRRDLGVIAVRNDEMVLFKELFDQLVYKERQGNVVRRELKEKEKVPFGLVHIAPADADWVGLINTKEHFGFFSLRLNASVGNFEGPAEFELKPGTYFYAPSEANYVYWVRPLIYTWADFATNTLLTRVPEGSFFYEKNAYLVLRFEEDFARRVDEFRLRLTRPLRVF